MTMTEVLNAAIEAARADRADSAAREAVCNEITNDMQAGRLVFAPDCPMPTQGEAAMPVYSATLACNADCYVTIDNIGAFSPEDAISRLREDYAANLCPKFEPHWKSIVNERIIDLCGMDGNTAIDHLPTHISLAMPEAPEVVHAPAEVGHAEYARTAMAIWEAVLEDDIWPEFRADNGAAEAREVVLELTHAVDEGWKIAHAEGEGFDAQFDCEFVPWFLSICVTEAHGRPALLLNWRALCAAMAEESYQAREDIRADKENDIATKRNTERAAEAEAGLDAYWHATGNSGDDNMRGKIGDLMCGLMHLARREWLDPAELIDAAKMHFDAETPSAS